MRWLILLVLLLTAAVIAMEQNLSQTMLDMAFARAYSMAVETINRAVKQAMGQGVTYEELIDAQMDAQGRVSMLRANTMRMNDKATQERQAKERAEALEISKKMKDMAVVVMAKGGGAGKLFGSVTNAEIAEALEKQEKITLDKRKIVVDPIKTTGVYTAKCKLGYEITADLKVEVKEL